jgi:hypothetical protein
MLNPYSVHFTPNSLQRLTLTCLNSQNIKEGLDGHAATWYSDIFKLVFPNIDRDKANTCKACEWKNQESSKKQQASSTGSNEADADSSD